MKLRMLQLCMKRHLFFSLAVPTITTTNVIEVLNGERVTLECLPSNSNLNITWRYETINGDSGEIAFQFDEGDGDGRNSIFSIPSSNLHQIIIPVADVADTGSYTCIIQGPPGDSEMISETISLTVEPGG